MKIYLFDDTENITPQLCDKLISSLPDDRKQKALRYRGFNDRVLCAVSYKLLEYALVNEYGIEHFLLAYKENGKPYIADRPDVFFNISHCKNACACAVSASEVGVDIQHTVAPKPSLLKRVCSDNEKALIAASPEPEKTFTGIWCLKEAYLKMLGVGIATDMKKADTVAPDFPAAMVQNESYSLAVCERAGKSEDIALITVHLTTKDIMISGV